MRDESAIPESERGDAWEAPEAPPARAAPVFLRWPWVALDALTGGMASGTVHYVVGFSGLGKSTFIRAAILRWASERVKVDILPLEATRREFATALACQAVGVDPGEIASGDYCRNAGGEERKTLADAALGELLDTLIADDDNISRPLAIHGAHDVDLRTLTEACKIAAYRGAQVLIADHIDHLTLGENVYQETLKVNRGALRLAQKYKIVLLLMSQANQQALLGSSDYLAKYAPLRDNHVLGGGTKRQVASSMLSLFRPLDPTVAPERLTAARKGLVEPSEVLAKGQIGVSLMKSRSYGGREGKRCILGWKAGSVVDLDAETLVSHWHGV